MIDEARRRIADDSLPEDAVKADQYIPALVCELASDAEVTVVTADKKLRAVIREIINRRGMEQNVTLADPLTIL